MKSFVWMTGCVGLAISVFVASAIAACGGSVSLGETEAQQRARLSSGSSGAGAAGTTTYPGTGETLCPLSDCSHQGTACTASAVREMRCVESGNGYPAVGDRCLQRGKCLDDGVDPARCPRECETWPMTGACAPGDVCRMPGDALGHSQTFCYTGKNESRWQTASFSKDDADCAAAAGDSPDAGL